VALAPSLDARGPIVLGYLGHQGHRYKNSFATMPAPANRNSPRKSARAALLALLASALTACASTSAVVVGPARNAVTPADVRVYVTAPAAFEDIAALSASRKSVYLFAGDHLDDKIIERLKQQAARLGANGVILGEFTDDDVVSLGGGVGGDSYTHNGDISLGIGGAFILFKRTGKGRAIYVPPGESSRHRSGSNGGPASRGTANQGLE
jgi:hypothetical protein